MSKLEELIQQYCPDGVEWKALYSITKQFSGMTGVSNKWAEEGNCVFIDYNNVYNHTSVDTTALKIATVKSLKQNTLKKGDILFTSASETPDECALSSVIEKDLPDGVFLDDHLFGLRLLDEYSSVISPSYLKYAFRSEQFRVQIKKVVRGATRHYVSKVDFMKLEIPVPPLPVQEEIVRVLDAFTELQAELQAELQKRKQQYNYYLDNLLNFKNINRGGYQAEVKWMKIGDICDVFTGGEVPMGSIKGNTSFGSFIYPIWGNGKDIYGYATTYQIDKDAVCISSIGANSGAVFFHKAYFTPIIRLKVLIPRNQGISVRYLFYILSFVGFDVKKSSVPNMNSNEVKQKVIPIPSLVEQQRIVSILDRFDTLTTDLTQGLPAEIEKRRQQYEYYRDKLLTFKRKGA